MEGEDHEIGSGEDLTDEEGVHTPDGGPVVEVSDSPCSRTDPHRPAAQEEELAAVLLAKDQYSRSDIVPFNEDCDYPFSRKSWRLIRECKFHNQ